MGPCSVNPGSATTDTQAEKQAIAMSKSEKKEKLSISLDKGVVERIDNIPGVKRSTLINEVMEEWLDEQGY